MNHNPVRHRLAPFGIEATGAQVLALARVDLHPEMVPVCLNAALDRMCATAGIPRR